MLKKYLRTKCHLQIHIKGFVCKRERRQQSNNHYIWTIKIKNLDYWQKYSYMRQLLKIMVFTAERTFRGKHLCV